MTVHPGAPWLEASRPPPQEPGILHGDFHLDNCLFRREPPIAIAGIVDWEISTIGDPLLDLGLLLALWGPDRLDPPAFPHIQAISRLPGSPSREELAARYAERSGRPVEHLAYYMALALWKLAAIVESDYARDLEHDVPRLLDEAAVFAGLD